MLRHSQRKFGKNVEGIGTTTGIKSQGGNTFGSYSIVNPRTWGDLSYLSADGIKRKWPELWKLFEDLRIRVEGHCSKVVVDMDVGWPGHQLYSPSQKPPGVTWRDWGEIMYTGSP